MRMLAHMLAHPCEERTLMIICIYFFSIFSFVNTMLAHMLAHFARKAPS